MSDCRPEIVLCTQGTRGDLAPFLSLAVRLMAEGRRVTILANANWEACVHRIGAAFLPMGPADPPQTGRDDRRFFRDHIVPSFRRNHDLLVGMVRSGRRPTVLFRSSMAGAAAAVEKLGLVGGCVYLQPSAILSRVRPSWPLTPLAGGPLAPLGRRLFLPALLHAARLINPFRAPTNGFRRSIGLAPMALLSPPRASFHLMLCPDWFALPQPDWPEHCYVSGFAFPPPETALPEPVAAFVKRYGPPLVFTPGTGVSGVETFVAHARETARTLGMPAIIVTPHTPAGIDGAARIMTTDFVDLAALLPGSRALVHHGGIGTLAQALNAGVPQLIVAGRFDQPDNAVRVAQLGLGGAILRPDARAPTWSVALSSVLASDHVRQQVATARALVRRADGPGAAIAVLAYYERLAGVSAAPAEVAHEGIVRWA